MMIKCNTPACLCQNLPRHLKSPEDRFIYTNKDKKFIWLDIPKCASTSLRSYLFPPPHHQCQGYKTAQDYKDSFFKFAFARNPYDRAVSNYAMFKQQKVRIKQLRSYNLSWVKPRKFSFKDFLMMITKIDNHHWSPQVAFLPFETDFIGRLENLQEDLNTVCDKINVPQHQLPHKNKTRRKHYREYYDSHTIKMVQEIYKDDFQKLNYNF